MNKRRLVPIKGFHDTHAELANETDPHVQNDPAFASRMPAAGDRA